MSTEKKLRFETLQLHVGQENPDPATDARAVLSTRPQVTCSATLSTLPIASDSVTQVISMVA